MQIIIKMYRSACVVRDKTGRPSKRYHNVHLRTHIFIQNINIRFVFLLFVIIVSAHVRLVFPKRFGGICSAATTINWEPSKTESPAPLRAHRTERGREMSEKKISEIAYAIRIMSNTTRVFRHKMFFSSSVHWHCFVLHLLSGNVSGQSLGLIDWI